MRQQNSNAPQVITTAQSIKLHAQNALQAFIARILPRRQLLAAAVNTVLQRVRTVTHALPATLVQTPHNFHRDVLWEPSVSVTLQLAHNVLRDMRALSRTETFKFSAKRVLMLLQVHLVAHIVLLAVHVLPVQASSCLWVALAVQGHIL